MVVKAKYMYISFDLTVSVVNYEDIKNFTTNNSKKYTCYMTVDLAVH